MKKNKGFTLVETLIVSAFVLGTLTYLFIQIDNSITNFDISFKYDSISDLNNTMVVYNFIKESGYTNLTKSIANGYVDITNSSMVLGNSSYYNLIKDKINAKRIIIAEENMVELKKNLSSLDFSEELKRYIKRYDNDQAIIGEYIIIVEFNNDHIASVRLGE